MARIEDISIKRKKIKRADRFKRIKNKKEKVYRTPDFFRNHTGIRVISESGISERQKESGVYVKAYRIQKNQEDKQTMDHLYEICKSLCKAQMYLQFFREREGFCLVLGQWMPGMEKAQERFSEIEEQMKTELLPFDINGRIERCCRIGAELKGRNIDHMDYLTQPGKWKEIIDLRRLPISDGRYLQSDAGCFAVAAMQKFPVSEESHWMEDIWEQEFVMASVSEFEMISDSVVKNLFFHCYTGVENVISRMKRSNPVLHQVLTEEEKEDNAGFHFIKGSVGFLLKAETAEQMEEQIELLKEAAKKNHLKIRCSCFSDTGIFRTFALTGERFDSSGQILLVSDCKSLMPFSVQKEENYDVEELKRLFLQ